MDLLTFLKQNDEARKIFGKAEINIIEKQLLGIHLTQSEKNRLSRDVRRKFEFISRVSEFRNEFLLKKGSRNKEIVDQTKKIIINEVPRGKIKRIILFGSVARKEAMPRSDIDIAIQLNRTTPKEAFVIRKRILGNTNKRVDIQIVNTLPIKVKKNILKDGKVIYGNRKKT